MKTDRQLGGKVNSIAIKQDPCRHSLVMGKLKDSLFFRLAAFNPSISINSGHASFIEQRLQQLFNSFHTPTHPPYALMIKRAIMELNEETGSTEEAISEFIRREFEDLPWAHVRILDVHLRKLCLDGELVCAKNGRYTECKRSKKRKNSRERKRARILESGEGIERDNGMQDHEIKEQILVSELHGAGTNNLSRVAQCQGTGVTEEHSEADECQGWMAQAQSEAEDQAQGLGLERPPNPFSDAHQSHQQRQPQPCMVENSSGLLNKS